MKPTLAPWSPATPDEADALAFVQVVAGDADAIPYRPVVARMVGSVLGAIFLGQMTRRWAGVGRRPFYKFAAPCGHEWYRSGDSWQEELAFSRSELQTAQNHVATKITQGASKGDVFTDITPQIENGVLLNAAHLIAFWTDGDRVTWYQLNAVLFGRALRAVYYPTAFAPRVALGDCSYATTPPPAVETRVEPPQTEAERQQKEGVADWSPRPGQPSRGPLFESLCKVCGVNYYRLADVARLKFEKAMRDLGEDGRTPDQLLNDFAPAWLIYWRCVRGGNRRPTPAEVVSEWDAVLSQESRDEDVARANAGKPKTQGGNNGKQNNAERIREAAASL